VAIVEAKLLAVFPRSKMKCGVRTGEARDGDRRSEIEEDRNLRMSRLWILETGESRGDGSGVQEGGGRVWPAIIRCSLAARK